MSHCLVCNDANAQHHYGTVCCPSCKGFFRRVFLSNKTLDCYRGNCCEINKNSRNSCRACRYKKCLAAGMNVNDIRGRAENTSPNIVLPDTDEMYMLSENADIFDGPDLPSEFTAGEKAEQLANYYLNLDRFCENASYTSQESQPPDEVHLIDRMFDCSVIELIKREGPQCPRFQRSWLPTEFVDPSNFRRSWARDIVSFLDWTSHFPPYKKLSEDDKLCVFVGRFTQFTLLTKAYRTYREGCSGLLLGCGNVFPYDREPRSNIQDEHLRTLFSRLTDCLFAEVIFPMAHQQITDADYALIKANVILFQGITFSNMSREGKALLTAEKTRHRDTLMAQLQAKKESFEENLSRVVQIENMFTSIESISNFMDKEINYLHVFDLVGMGRNLVKGMHIDKYRFEI